MSLFSGISYFTSDITKPPLIDLVCRACQSALVGIKSRGPTSSPEAMLGHGHDHWSYSCPNSEKGGHAHLVHLVREIEQFHSERLQNIVTEELLQKRKAFRRKEK